MNHLTVVPKQMKNNQQQNSNNGQGGPPEPDECPVCGMEFAKKAVIKRGLHWKDLYQGTAWDYLTRYRRRCGAKVDVEEERQVGGDEIALYFHDDKRTRP